MSNFRPSPSKLLYLITVLTSPLHNGSTSAVTELVLWKSGQRVLLVPSSASVQLPRCSGSLDVPQDSRTLLTHGNYHLGVMNKEPVTSMIHFTWDFINDYESWNVTQNEIPNILSMGKIILFSVMECFPYRNWNFVTDSFYKTFNNNISFNWALLR